MISPSNSHIRAIDGMRALAVLAVILFHLNADWLPGGFSGVDLFFVVSGFVISQSLTAHVSSSPAAPSVDRLLLDFYRRRALRLLPALLLVLLVTFVLSALLIPRTWRNDVFDHTGLAALVGVSNVVLTWQGSDYFSPGADLNPFLHTWTLGVEEQFYLLFPLLFLLWLHGRQTQAWARLLLPVLALCSLLAAAWQTSTAPASAFYLLPARLWELAAGALLFQFISTRPPRRHAAHLAAPGLSLLLAGFAFASEHAFPFPGALVTVLGTVLLLAAAMVPADPARPARVLNLLRWPLLGYLGRLSYSLYLWHWPLLVLLRWTCGLQGIALWLYPVALLALASASYHLLEVPFRRGSGWRMRPLPVLATAALAVGLSAGAAYALVQHADELSLSTTGDATSWRSQRYPAWKPLPRIDEPALAGRRLFVFGDSHAAAYRTLASMTARSLDMQLDVQEHGGCAVVSLLGAQPADCAEASEQALRHIEALARPGDIVLLASLRMPELRDRDWRRGDAAMVAAINAERDPADSHAARQDAEQVLTRLQALRVHILIDAPLPLFKAPAYRCSDSFNRMNPACAAGLQMSRASLQELRAPQMALLQTLAGEHPLLTVWDPFPLLCPGETCSAMQGERPLFFDQDHLSGYGNQVLLADFIRVLRGVAAPDQPATDEP